MYRREFLKFSIASLGAGYAGLAHTTPRAVIPAPGLPPPVFVETNGITMGFYEQGSGPAVVFCHGFPELAFSWRHQIQAVASAGFRAIAPDQRGYGLTGGPRNPELYTLKHLCDDIAGLLDARGIDKAVFCGHDWGGGVVWAMPRLHPDRCLGVIGINTPAGRPQDLPPVPDRPPSLIVRSPDYYQATFMTPGRAEAVLEADVRRTFDFFLTRGGIWDIETFATLPEDSAERKLDLLSLLQLSQPPGEPFLPDEVMRYFADTFEVTGFTGGLNWYRMAPRIGEILAGTPSRIEVPCLYIGAANDVILPPSSSMGMEDFISDLEKYTVEDSGHWTQQEQPDEVNQVMIDWLKRKIA